MKCRVNNINKDLRRKEDKPYILDELLGHDFIGFFQLEDIFGVTRVAPATLGIQKGPSGS